jgi:hypothetical protein
MIVTIDSAAKFSSPRSIQREVSALAKELNIHRDICIHERSAKASAGFSLRHFRFDLYLPRDFPKDSYHDRLPKEYILRRELVAPLFLFSALVVIWLLAIPFCAVFALLSTLGTAVFTALINRKVLLVLFLKSLLDLFTAGTLPLLAESRKIFEFFSPAEAHKKAFKALSLRKKIEVAHCFVDSKEKLCRLLTKQPWWRFLNKLKISWEIEGVNHLLKTTEVDLKKLSGISRLYAKTIYSGHIGFLSTWKISSLWKSWRYLLCSKNIICQKPISAHFCSRHSG